MVNIIYTGKDFNVGYIIPSTGSLPASTTAITATLLPVDSRISTLNVKNNLKRLYELGQRNYADIVTLKFDGALSLDMPLYNEEQLKLFLEGSNPYTIGTPEVDFVIKTPYTAYRYVSNFIPTSFSISIKEEDVVRISVDGAYKTEELFTPDTANGGSVTLNPPAAGQYATHIQTTVGSFAGVANWQVKSLNVRFNLNNELKWGIGSRTFQAVAPRGIEGSADVEIVYDQDLLKYFYGDGTSTTPQGKVNSLGDITFNVALDQGGTLKTFTITLSGVYLDEVDAPVQPNEEATMTLRLLVSDISISIA